jgi:hypothetical protein
MELISIVVTMTESIKNFQAKIAWPWNTVEKCNTTQGLEKIMAKRYVHGRPLNSTEVTGCQYLVEENPVQGITELYRNVSSENSLRQHCAVKMML